MVIHYEEVLYQVYAPLPLPLRHWVCFIENLFNGNNFVGSAAFAVVCALLSAFLITLRANLSGTVYCNRSYVCVFVCVWVCYQDNSKLRASIYTKLGL